MKKSSVHVVPAAGGWAVQSKVGQQATTVYSSKDEAVTAARNKATSPASVLVRTVTGQILRPPEIKPSHDPEMMRSAVLQAVKKKGLVSRS